MEIDDIVLRSHYTDDGDLDWIEVMVAPPRSRISTAVLKAADPRFFTLEDDMITIAGRPPVTYRICGADRAYAHAVEVERIS